jgi:hypothetical protein
MLTKATLEGMAVILSIHIGQFTPKVGRGAPADRWLIVKRFDLVRGWSYPQLTGFVLPVMARDLKQIFK